MSKKIIFVSSSVLSFVFFFSFNSAQVLAAWIATDNFDSYTAGSSLNGANGGTNWTGAWTVNGGVWTSDTAPAGGQGGLALYSTTTLGTNPQISRTFTPISAGTFHYQFRFSDVTGGAAHQVNVILGDSTNTGGAANTHRIAIALNVTAGGDIDASDGQTYNTSVGTFVANTWNTIDIKFDNALGNVFQVSVNGGPYSADFNSGGSLANIDSLVVLSQETSANNFWLDDINTSGSPLANNITGFGTINRLAKFITGTSISDALFSDDGVNTTLTNGNFLLQIGSLIDSVTNGVLNFGTTQATTMNFGRSGQNMIINSKVGIGTSTPTALLHVDGDFFAKIINIAADGLGLDTLTAGTLSIGSTIANAINIGRADIVTTFPGLISFGKATTISTCNSTTTPASCGSASAGSIALPNGSSTLVVNTTAVTTNSQIFITEDSSLGSRLGITCNKGIGRSYSVRERIAGTSFTIKSSSNPAINKACLSYWIVN